MNYIRAIRLPENLKLLVRDYRVFERDGKYAFVTDTSYRIYQSQLNRAIRSHDQLMPWPNEEDYLKYLRIKGVAEVWHLDDDWKSAFTHGDVE